MFYCIIMKSDSQAIFKYDTKAGALAKFHDEMGYAYKQGITTTCVVMDNQGASHKSEAYTAPMEVATEG